MIIQGIYLQHLNYISWSSLSVPCFPTTYWVTGKQWHMWYAATFLSLSSGERAGLYFNESFVLWFNQCAELLGLPEKIHSSIWLPGNCVLHYQYRTSFQLFCSCCFHSHFIDTNFLALVTRFLKRLRRSSDIKRKTWPEEGKELTGVACWGDPG